MARLLKGLKVPVALTAAAVLVGGAGTAFAATHSHTSAGAHFSLWGHGEQQHHSQDSKNPSNSDSNVRTGAITAVSAGQGGTSGTITVSGTQYNLSSNVQVHYHDYVLKVSQITTTPPPQGTIRLNSTNAVTAIWLKSDANLPSDRVLKGQVKKVGSNSITVDGYTLDVSSNVVVKSQDQTVAFSTISANQWVRVFLNRSGTVTRIVLSQQEKSGDVKNVVRGTVSSAAKGTTSSTSITVGGQSYPYASNVHIRYGHYHLTPSEVPVGSQVIVDLNSSGDVVGVMLQTDPQLPKNPKLSGTIAALGQNSITIGSYSLSLASTFNITYTGATSLTNSLAQGETARVHLNATGKIDSIIVGKFSSQGSNGDFQTPNQHHHGD